MAARPTWKGFLKVSLVSIPIKVFPATESSGSISFNQLHGECQSRIEQKKWCPKCAREVKSAELVRGYEFEKGRYVIVSDEELAAVQPESTKVIELAQFARVAELDPIYIDRSYYLAPDSERAGEAFTVIRQALAGQVGVGKLAVYGREYLVAVRAPDRVAPALLLHTLHHEAEIRSVADLVAEDVATLKPPAASLRMARAVVRSLQTVGALDLGGFTDAYKADLQKLLDAKIAGDQVVVPPVLEPPATVSLREALARSLQAVQQRGSKAKKPLRAVPPQLKQKRAS